MRAVIPVMQQLRSGSIINVSSIWLIAGAAGVAAYTASKGAVRLMSKNAALSYVDDGIRLNSCTPGSSRTPMIAAQDDGINRRHRRRDADEALGQADRESPTAPCSWPAMSPLHDRRRARHRRRLHHPVAPPDPRHQRIRSAPKNPNSEPGRNTMTRTIENRDLWRPAGRGPGRAAGSGRQSSPVEIGDVWPQCVDADCEDSHRPTPTSSRSSTSSVFAGFKQALSDHGVETVQLEFISNWDRKGDLRVALGPVRDELFAACAELGATPSRSARADVVRPGEPVTRSVSPSRSTQLPLVPVQHGVRVAVEPMPMSNIMTIV